MGILNILFITLLVSGCTSATHTKLSKNDKYRERDPRQVLIINDQPPRKAKPLGVIAISRWGENATWAMEVLKMEAADMGADAVTNIEMNYTPGLFPTLRIQGLAVKYE